MTRLMRLLLLGYGLAAAASAGLFSSGASLATTLGFAWVGGALATFLLASLAAARAPRPGDAEAATPEDADAALAEALRMWEEDRLLDAPAPQERRAAS